MVGRFWHDAAHDCAGPLLDNLLVAEGWTIILQSCQAGWHSKPKAAVACAEKSFGRGKIIICLVKLAGRTGTNPIAELFARRLFDVQPEQPPSSLQSSENDLIASFAAPRNALDATCEQLTKLKVRP